MSRWIALGIAALSCLIALRTSADAALAMGLMNLLALSMILRPNWYTFWMPLGFWEQRASDVGQADKMGPAIALLGWIVLLIALYLSTRF